MVKLVKSISLLLVVLMTACGSSYADNSFDIVVYGGTCSGITAAIQAKRMGKNVALVCPEEHLGGLTISGLGWTDTKDTNCIGGLSREFYHRIWLYYNDPEAWIYQTRSSYNVSWQAGAGIQDGTETMWTFEPHVAEEVFNQWLSEENVTVVRNRWLDRGPDGVRKHGNMITAIKTLAYDKDFGFSPAETYRGKMFIDASYEGDLMASSGVSYRIGRDSNSEYNETLNGIYFKSTDLSPGKSPYSGIDPYWVPGDPTSGLIPQIENEFTEVSQIGKADNRLQAFNFRMCMTDVSSNRVPVSKPLSYDEKDYELLFRLYEAGQNPGFTDQRMPNLKTDNNNSGLMSLDWPGGNYSIEKNWNYSEADYIERINYVKRQRDYQQGLLWTMLYHPRVPAASRNSRIKWGLPKDEFIDNDHWPYFPYVREARRLEGEMVMTEHHVKMASGYTIYDSIGQGSYSLDSHVVRRVVIDGAIWDEGGFYLWWSTGYPISYRSILPQRQQSANLLVPVCLSASHAAFGSIRMEPTYMILGQSAATAASLAIDYEYDIQDVPYDLLRIKLLQDGQRLKETFSSDFPSVLLNFGSQIADNANSPAHEIGKVSGISWNLVTADKSSGIFDSNGNSTNLSVNLGKSLPGQKIIDWDLHGFNNSSLGIDYNTGIYSGNARSAIFVNDGKDSHVSLGIRISGLDAGIYGLYLTANNTNTTVHDTYNIYSFDVELDSIDSDFSDKASVLLENTKEYESWLFDKNFAISQISLSDDKDLVVVVEGLAAADYRAFLNTLEIVKLGRSPLMPVIVSEPQDLYINNSEFDDHIVECRFKSSTLPTAKWYKSVAEGNDIPVTDFMGEIIEDGPAYDNQKGYYVSRLIFNSSDSDYQGDYYCIIDNSVGSIVSQTASLFIKELLAHWSLDAEDYSNGYYLDESGYDRNVAATGAPSFLNGADNDENGAISLTSVNGTGIVGRWNPLESTGKFSISCWVFWTGGNQTSIIMDKSDSWDASQMMWVWGLNPSTNRINFVAVGSTEFQTPIDQAGFRMNEWHHLIVTYDLETHIAQLYVDMELVNSGMVNMGTGSDSILKLGVDVGGRTFQGQLDDVRIYNYVLDQAGVIEAYNGAALHKVSTCNTDWQGRQFDFSGPNNIADCIVDISDLSVLLDNWLSCGLYPLSECEK